MKNIVILSNHHVYTYNFRKEIIEAMLKRGPQGTFSFTLREKVDKLIEMGCDFTDIALNRRGTGLFTELKLLLNYLLLLIKLKPDYVYTYTIKPNIYGGIVCGLLNIPFSPNITGLGSAFNKGSRISNILLKMYKFGLKMHRWFFQNEENKNFFVNNKLLNSNYTVIPGSGVNLNAYSYLRYPEKQTPLSILYIGRIMEEKGINELYDASLVLKEKYPNVQIQLIGFCEDDYVEHFEKLKLSNSMSIWGIKKILETSYKNSHAIILPSYNEGMSNVLLEAAASGRPVIASNISGCKEIFNEGITGFGFEPRDTSSMIKAIESFIELDYKTKALFGKNGRKKVLEEFDRQIIVEAYLKVLQEER